MPPDEFIPLAERTGLIVPLAEVVLDQALGRAAAWSEVIGDAGVAVNLSVGNLTSGKIVDSVAELLERHRVAPERLTLEVTESQIMADEAHHVAVLEALADIGVKISVDDFGTGYSSFAYLTRLPVDEVKIDRSFVGSMDVSTSDAAIVRAVIALGRDLGLSVVAEGVEKPTHLQTLCRLGCAVAQGYHIGRPMPSADFEALAGAWNTEPRTTVEVGEPQDVVRRELKVV